MLDPIDLLRSFDEDWAGQEFHVPSEHADFKRHMSTRPPKLESAAAAAAPSTAPRPTLLAQLLPGGLAGAIAQWFVQPVETLKVRLQVEASGKAPVKYGSLTNALAVVVREEGAWSLWKGMAPSFMRELSYSSLRFGLYKPIKTLLGAGTPRDTPLWKMILAGGTAGGVASAVATPTDLLKTRMQGEATGRPLFVHAKEIYAQGGISAFWRGVTPTAIRGASIGAVKMATYDKAKVMMEGVGQRKGSIGNFVGASLLTAANTVLWTTPADFMRTLVMTGDGTRSMFTLATDAVRANGPLALWKGWLPQMMRILPYGTLQAIFMEKIAMAMGSSMT